MTDTDSLAARVRAARLAAKLAPATAALVPVRTAPGAVSTRTGR